MSDFITVLRKTCPMPVVDATKWKRIGGDPHTVNLNAYVSRDGSKIMGTWICTPGKFEVNYEKWEYCHFLDGYCIITPEGEEPVHLKAGDVFVIEPGMKGTWEVVETVRSTSCSRERTVRSVRCESAGRRPMRPAARSANRRSAPFRSRRSI